MKKIFLPALLSVALLAGTTACTDNKTQADNTATADNQANDNYMRNGTNGEANAQNDGDMTGDTSKPSNDSRTGPMGLNGYSDDTKTPMATTDPEFMMTAAHSDQNEIQISKYVLSKGVTGMAKDHANMMVKDHTKSTTDLQAVAQKKGVTLPADMDDAHKAMLKDLERYQGQELSTKYMEMMAGDHDKTVRLMQSYQTKTQDPDVKGFITKTLPVVQNHLNMFKQHSNL
jgi:putative membrane protein